MRRNFGVKPWTYPQPVFIIATYGEDGTPDAMNAAWGGIVGRNEIIIDLSNHKTTENLLETRAFTVSVADLEHLVPCESFPATKSRTRWRRPDLPQQKVNL